MAYSKDKNTELLFITLNKSEKDFSPTTLYDDFAISENPFHWQTQNAVSPGKGKGLSYINHVKDNKKILLFVREKNEDENGNTMAFVFLGEGKLIEHYYIAPDLLEAQDYCQLALAVKALVLKKISTDNNAFPEFL